MDVVLEPEENDPTPGQSSPHMVTFTSLRQNVESEGDSHDAVLVLDSGRKFPVNRILLATHSPVLKALFTFPGKSHPDGVYPLQAIPDSSVEANLTWIYDQSLPLSLRNVTTILEGAHYLDCQEVTQRCLDFIIMHLSPKNALSLAAFARFHQISALADHCQRFIEYHFRQVVKQPEFLAIECSTLFEILWWENLNATEQFVWYAVVRWIEADIDYRRVFLPTLMRAIRFCQVGYDFLIERVIPQAHQILPDDPEIHANLVRYTSFFHKVITWTEHPGSSSGEPLLHSCPRLSQDVIIVFGGWSGDTAVNLMESYDLRVNRWSTLAFMDPLGERAHFGAACLGSKIYFVGGFDNGRELRSVSCFDLLTQTFSTCSPMHHIRNKVSVVASNGYLYAMGGCSGSRRSKTVERYDPELNVWTKMVSMKAARSEAGATIHEGKIVVAGGFDGYTHLDTVETFNLNTRKWTSLGKMCTRRSGLCLVSLNGILYAIGGNDGRTHLPTVEYYDPRHRSWHFVPSMLHPRSNFCALAIDGTLIVMGGFDGLSNICSVESYHPSQRRWCSISSLNVGRSALGACLVTGNHLNPATLIKFAYFNRNGLMEEMLASGEMPEKPRYWPRIDFVEIQSNSDGDEDDDEDSSESDEREDEAENDALDDESESESEEEEIDGLLDEERETSEEGEDEIDEIQDHIL